MRKRFKRLKKILGALNIDFDDRGETLEIIQAGIFLAQLMRQNEAGEIDLTGQTGYFFKWYDGPHASSLNAEYRDLLNYMRFENATNGYSVEPPALVPYAETITEVVSPPDDVSRADWMRTLAVIAYLQAASGLEKDATIERADSILDVDVDTHFEKAKSQIDTLLQGVPAKSTSQMTSQPTATA